MASKLAIEIGGVTEFALKLLPLLAGCFSIILMWWIARIYIRQQWKLAFILALWSFSEISVRYATEFKQYSLDAMLTLLLVYAFLKFPFFKNKNSWLWALGGALAVWTSMPSVFVLASIGFLWLMEAWKDESKTLFPVLLTGIFWLGNFALYFFTILKSDAGSDYLQNFHGEYFFDLFPTDAASLKKDWSLLEGIFRSVTDKTFISIIFSILLLGSGSFYLFKKKFTLSILLILPVVLTMLASHFHLYSLLDRVKLFFLPLLILIAGFGLEILFKKSHKALRVVLIALAILVVINKDGYPYFIKKMEFEDSKSCLTGLQEIRNQDRPIVVHHDAYSAFIFYNNYHQNAFQFSNYYKLNWNQNPTEVLPDRTVQWWLFFSHTSPSDQEEAIQEAKQKYVLLKDESWEGSRVVEFGVE
ncbi:MAG: hypothetical protein R2879_08330 [Saprospiraceae bacterium]